jgi:hypothetical protein
MKKIFFLLLIISATQVQGQKLKDLLYSGKLKNDSGTVIRKDDDLSTKIDTTRKKTPEPEIKTVGSQNPSSPGGTNNNNPAAENNGATTNQPNGNAPADAGPKDNNSIWKEYMATFMEELKTDVVPDKRLKPGTYYILIEYEIGVDGSVSINNVLPSPESDYLKDQIKKRMTLSAPQMSPVMASGKARKVVKKYNFTLLK